jgi:hypothetical protein
MMEVTRGSFRRDPLKETRLPQRVAVAASGATHITRR